MRRWLISVGTLCLVAGFTAGARASDKPQLELTDPNLPVYEVRPLDRRVHGLTLEGTWNQPAKSGSHHYINLLFANGRSYSVRVDEHPVAARKLISEAKDGKLVHRQVEDSAFRRGEVRCLIPNHQLIRNGLAAGGKFKIVVSVDKAVASANAPEVVSNALEISWPLDRAVAHRPPRSRHADAEPVDAMPRDGGVGDPRRALEPRRELGTIRTGG